MNFLYLKEIVAQLKHRFRCPGCRKYYSNRSIDIFTPAGKELDVALTCQKCQIQTFAKVSFVEEDDIKLALEKQGLDPEALDLGAKPTTKGKRKHRNIKVSANHVSKVTENDVLDVKNFLKDFKGSFSSIFNNK
jgi:hypothetical protein